MSESLAAFVPRRCVEFDLLEPGCFVAQDSTTLFVDVAGFTPLTDRLGAIGSRGTEELSQLMRHFFGAVVNTLLDRGGDPIAFGGDALTIVFDGPPPRALAAATAAADEIQQLAVQTAGTSTSAGPVTLATRIGIARGQVATAIAGSARRAVPVHLGSGLDLAVAAEAQTEAGRVTVHPSARQTSPPPHAPKPRPHARRREPGSDQPALLARMVNPVVLGRLNEGRALLESHRSISVAFVRFNPVEVRDLPRFLDRIGGLLEIVDGLGGEVVQVAGGDKGMVAMVVFGAPVAHSDDPLRAVQAMLELRRQDRSAAIAVATGPVFAALLGSERRRFPAHSGRAVNVAARLMQAAAPGQLLTENTTWQAGHHHLRQDGPVVDRTVKGSVEPVATRAVAGWRRGRRRAPAFADPPLIGRQAELDAIELLLDDVGRASGRWLVLTGEPGIGKSRLVREAVQRAATRGIGVVLADADDYPRGTSAGLWREILGGLTGTSSRAGSKAWREALTASLPHAEAQISVLGQLLGVRLGPRSANPLLPPRLEAELVQDLVADLLKSATREGALLLAVESAHRLDQASQDLLENVARGLPGSRVGLLVTRRSEDGAGETVAAGFGGARLALARLSEAEAAALAADSWRQSGGGSPPPWLSPAVARRAGGNPLFVRIVTTMLREHWEPGDPPPSDDFAAESLAVLMAAQVDQLPVLSHQLLNVLAVARRPCTAEEFAPFLPPGIEPAAVSRAASALAAGGFVRADTDDTGVRYRVQHEVLQQVVYERLSHAERARLHQGFATYLASTGADPIEVAGHVDRLGDVTLGRRWFPLAAESARASWDFPAAADWYRRALPSLSGAARDSAEVALLEVLLVAGRANEVLDSADDLEARRLGGRLSPSDGGPELGARFSLAVAEAAQICGNLDRSSVAATETMRLTDGVDEPRHQRAAELLVLALCARGDFRSAIRLAELQLGRAERSGDPAALTTAHAATGAALLLAGEPAKAAVHYEQALSAAVALGDVVAQVHVLSDLAGCAFESGEFATCVRLLAQARESADAIGYRRHLAFNLSNEAQLRVAVGDEHATACAAAAVQRSLGMGDLIAAANALHTWVTARPSTVRDPSWWRRLHAVDVSLGRSSVAAADAADLAVAAARRSNTDDALRWAEEAVRAAQETDQPAVLRRATLARLIAELRASRGAGNAARARLLGRLDSLLEEADASEVEHAEIALERWRATRTDVDRKAALARLHRAYATEPSTVVRSWFDDVRALPPARPPALPSPVGISSARTTRAQLGEAFDRLESATLRQRVDMTSL